MIKSPRLLQNGSRRGLFGWAQQPVDRFFRLSFSERVHKRGGAQHRGDWFSNQLDCIPCNSPQDQQIPLQQQGDLVCSLCLNQGLGITLAERDDGAAAQKQQAGQQSQGSAVAGGRHGSRHNIRIGGAVVGLIAVAAHDGTVQDGDVFAVKEILARCVRGRVWPFRSITRLEASMSSELERSTSVYSFTVSPSWAFSNAFSRVG